MEKSFIILVLLANQCYGVIYRLDDAEYERMPPLIQLDDFENCFNDANALYCTSQLRLVSDISSELYIQIANYSEWEITHYDHTKLYRGICVRRSCGEYFNEKLFSNITDIVEACVNKSLWRDYRLKATLLNAPSCRSADYKIEFDEMDILVTVICTSILIINVGGTLYDFYARKKSKSKAIIRVIIIQMHMDADGWRYCCNTGVTTEEIMSLIIVLGAELILAFSLLRNWHRLFQADYRSKPPIDILKGLDGVRAILMILLVLGHSFIPYGMAISNPHFVEEIYHILPYHLFLNGAVIVQAFFLMSGILLSYSLQRTAEKKTIKWTLLISIIWKRWLRLTPSFAVILGFTSTLLRLISSGPLVQLLEVTEIEDCRRSWMWNFFYLRNYKYDSQCMPQTWYLAADLHLYILGMIIIVFIRNTYWRNVVMATLFIIGVALPGLVTYLYDLTFLMKVSPRTIMRIFIDDPAYNYLYTPSHTNIPSFVMGLALGALIHNLQKRDFNLEKYKKFLPFYWAIIPCCVGILLLSGVNYMDGPPLPLYIRVIFHTFLRPVMGALIATIILGMVFKFDNFYRGLFEWDGWAWVARVSYGTYLIHLTVVRIILGNSTKLFTVSLLTIVPVIGMAYISFLGGTIIWLLIDAPVNQLVKIWLETPTKKNNKQKNYNIDVRVEKF